MALNDSYVLIAGSGAVLTGVVGTAVKPTLAQLVTFASAGTVPSGWTHAGHTSDDNLPKPGSDGGSSDTKSTWQAQPLRTVITPGTSYWDVDLLQWDNDKMSWYYGGGDPTNANEFRLPVSAPVPVNLAVCMVMIDGGVPIGYYAPKMSAFAGDDLSLSSDDFSIIPVRFTLLQLAGQPPATWIGARFGSGA